MNNYDMKLEFDNTINSLCLKEYINGEWKELKHSENIENVCLLDARIVIFATTDESLQLKLISVGALAFGLLKDPTKKAIVLHKLLWKI